MKWFIQFKINIRLWFDRQWNRDHLPEGGGPRFSKFRDVFDALSNEGWNDPEEQNIRRIRQEWEDKKEVGIENLPISAIETEQRDNLPICKF